MSAQHWQYEIVHHGTGLEQANAHMQEWASAGWELVSGSVQPLRGGTMMLRGVLEAAGLNPPAPGV